MIGFIWIASGKRGAPHGVIWSRFPICWRHGSKAFCSLLCVSGRLLTAGWRRGQVHAGRPPHVIRQDQARTAAPGGPGPRGGGGWPAGADEVGPREVMVIGAETVREFGQDTAREARGRMLVARGRVLIARGRAVQAQGKARKAVRKLGV